MALAGLRHVLCGLLMLSLLSETIGCFKLDSRCSFVKEEVKCVRANLTYIPEIPSNVSGLSFTDNYLPHVTRDTFMNVSDPRKFNFLRLAYDHILTIRNDSFESFTRLGYLHLSGNHIEEKSLMNLLGVLCHLKLSLNLDSMGLSSSPETFSHMSNCVLDETYMRRNKLVNVSSTFIQHFESVTTLDLDRNSIELFQLPYMKKLKTLFLSYTALTNFPNFCMENNTSVSLVPKLKHFRFKYNFITEIHPENFQCLTSLTEFVLTGNPLSVFPNDMLLYMPFIEYLQIRPNYGHNAYVEKYAFRSESLSSLDFGTDGPATFVFPSTNETFKHSPNLKYLRLFYMDMNSLSDSSLNGMFAHVGQLKSLTCYRCGLRRNLSIFIEDKTKLTVLDLGRNFLESVNINSISSKRHLRQLRLNRNTIKQLSPEIFSLTLLNKLDLIDLSGNPFTCDCNLKWFIDWLKTTNISKIHQPNKYTCAAPGHVGKSLFDVEFTYLECNPLKTWILVIVVGVSSFVLILTSLIVYCNRWKIKYLVDLYCLKRNYTQI